LVDAAAMVELLAGVFVDPLAGDAKYGASQAVTLAHTRVVSLGPATSARRHCSRTPRAAWDQPAERSGKF